MSLQACTRPACQIEGAGLVVYCSLISLILDRPEEERREFRAFLERWRHAKDKTEFDQFTAERRRQAAEPAEFERRVCGAKVTGAGWQAMSGFCGFMSSIHPRSGVTLARAYNRVLIVEGLVLLS